MFPAILPYQYIQWSRLSKGENTVNVDGITMILLMMLHYVNERTKLPAQRRECSLIYYYHLRRSTIIGFISI